MRLLRFDSPNFASEFSDFLAAPRGAPADVDASVADILRAVRTEGLAAVLRLTAEFDRVELAEADLRVSEADVEAGVAACPPAVLEALALAAERIEAYHKRQRPEDRSWTDACGVELGWRWRPLEAVGLYVPGGRAAYPSSVLMNAVPAKVAGVERIVMVTPPGRLEPAVLAAARQAGVTEIWRVGGAQACAALAFGAGPIRPVDKIVGPGNAFVTSAKRQLYGVVGIDALAGPSEIVVVADTDNDPRWIAADLLSQAEHDPDAQAVLVTPDAEFGRAVEREVEALLASLPPSSARASWERHGAIIIAPLAEAAGIVDRIAPEHAELAVTDPEALADQIRHVGAVFLGRTTPEAIGDYVAGSNHVLPTSRAARFSSGLSIYDFLKRTSRVRCDLDAFSVLGPPTVALAEAEGLFAHALSARIRLGDANTG